MDWTTSVSTILTLMIGNAAIIFPLFLWNRSESRTDNRRVLDLIEAINKEMKDFHGKLERQDAEFKAHLLYLHEGKK